MDSKDQKRKFERVKYPCLLTVWQEDGSQDILFAVTEDISAGGASLLTDQSVRAGSKVDVEMSFDTYGLRINCKARTVRCQRAAQEGNLPANKFAIAIEFLDMNDQQREALRGLIQQLIKGGK